MRFKDIINLRYSKNSQKSFGEVVCDSLNYWVREGKYKKTIHVYGPMLLCFRTPDHEITIDELVKYVSVEDMGLVYIKNSDNSIIPETFDDLCKIFGYTTDKVIEGSIPL